MRRAIIGGMLLVYGCATTPPPAPIPIVIQQPTPPPVAKVEPPKPVDPRIGMSRDILDAIANPEHPDVKQGIVKVHAYDTDKSWVLTLAPLHTAEIRLNKDEHYEQAACGDTQAWSIQGNDHVVFIKMLGDGTDLKMETNCIVSTDKRSYHIEAKRGRFVPAVAWYYPDEFKQQLAAYEAATAPKK